MKESRPRSVAESLASPRTLARNTAWNLLGLVAPMLAALGSIPVLVHRLGPDGFGVLGLAWMAVGYFSLFDLGLSRALTKLVADRLGAGRDAEIPGIVWTALGLMTAVGVIGAAVAVILTPWAVDGFLRIPARSATEARVAFFLIALAVPSVTCTAALRGLLEANQRFGLVNLLKVPLGVASYVGPALAAVVSSRVDVVVAVLVAIRYTALLAHLVACRRALPDQVRPVTFRRSLVRPLLAFGGWMTVSAVISPLMVYFDRLVIGAVASLAAVAYYVTPYEMVTKLWVVPGAFVAVLFPAFSASLVADPAHAARLLDKGIRYVGLVTFPITLGLATLAHLVLRLWVGEEMAAQGATVLQWLAAGVFLNGLAAVPFAFLQGAGRPDLTAKLHLVELPFYVALLWWAVQRFGIEGAAVAWTARVAVDTVAIFWLTRKVLPGAVTMRRSIAAIAMAVAWMAVGAVLGGSVPGGAFLIASFSVLAIFAWRSGLGEEERRLIRRAFEGIRGNA